MDMALSEVGRVKISFASGCTFSSSETDRIRAKTKRRVFSSLMG